MRKLILFTAVLFTLNVCSAAFSSATNETSVPTEQVLSKAEQEKMEMVKISTMSVKEYEDATGKKLNFFERATFKVIQKRMSHKIAQNNYDGGSDTEGFNIGGFALGFLLGLLGVLGAYIFSRDRNLRKWSWIGLGTVVVLSFLLLLI